MNNQDLIDTSIGHQVDLQFFANGVVRDEMGKLNGDDDSLFALLLAALLALPSNADASQIDAALAQAEAANAATYAQIEKDTGATLLAVADAEASFQSGLLRDLGPTALNAGAIYAAMIATPIMGATFAESMRSLAADRFSIIRRTIQAGFVARKSVEEMLRELRGTKSARYEDGLLNRARANLETIIRSSITHAAEYTAAAFHALNADIVKAVVWLSVLDGRTSPPCIARSGKRYTAKDHRPIGHSYDWGAGPGRYHYNCRSTSAPLVAGEVPNANRFQDWLRRQPAKVQDEVLGPTRGRMFRDGGVNVESFFNSKGRVLTLEQFRERSG